MSLEATLAGVNDSGRRRGRQHLLNTTACRLLCKSQIPVLPLPFLSQLQNATVHHLDLDSEKLTPIGAMVVDNHQHELRDLLTQRLLSTLWNELESSVNAFVFPTGLGDTGGQDLLYHFISAPITRSVTECRLHKYLLNV